MATMRKGDRTSEVTDFQANLMAQVGWERSDAAPEADEDDTVEVLTGKALDERAAELDIEGRSGMTADEKRAAIAEAEG